MNTHHNNRQHLIERLVDEELSFEEERNLIASLDQDPSGWKALAEMFLEDRALRDTLGSNGKTSSELSKQGKMKTEPTRSHRRVIQYVALATAVLVAFVAGRFSTPSAELPSNSTVAEVDQIQELAPEHDSEERQLPPSVEYVTLSLPSDDNAHPQQIDVPILPWKNAVVAQPTQRRPAPDPFVPEDVRNILAKSGQAIAEQMTYIPFEMPDGRSGVIPVSNIEVLHNRFPEIQ